jgi:flagellar hook-length control protein FliK
MSVFLSDLAGVAGLAPEPLRPEAAVGPLPTADGPAFADRLADAWPLLQGQSLATVPLGPSLEVITAAQPAPVVDSLVRFALAQGIDPQSVAWLLQQPLQASEGRLSGEATAELARQGELAVALPPTEPVGPALSEVPDAPLESAEPPPVLPALWPLWALRERAPMVASVATPAATAPPGFSPLPLPAAGAQGLSTAQWPPSDPDPLPQAAQPGPAQSPKAAGLVIEAVMGPSKADPLPLLAATGAGAAVVKALLVPPNLARPLSTSVGTHPAATTLAGPVEGVSLGAVSAGWGGGATPAPASSAAFVLLAPGSEAATHIERQADIAQRLADALGQRIQAMVERGQWQVRLTLRPESLGEVDIDLKMQGGQLDAQFRAGLALTRELLQDGMPRLRDVLLNLGMDVAGLGVSSGSQSKTGGNPTPSPFAHRAGQGTSVAHEGVSGALAPGSPAHRPAEGPGWDVMV